VSRKTKAQVERSRRRVVAELIQARRELEAAKLDAALCRGERDLARGNFMGCTRRCWLRKP
jgi:hypothetical protein